MALEQMLGANDFTGRDFRIIHFRTNVITTKNLNTNVRASPIILEQMSVEQLVLEK